MTRGEQTDTVWQTGSSPVAVTQGETQDVAPQVGSSPAREALGVQKTPESVPRGESALRDNGSGVSTEVDVVPNRAPSVSDGAGMPEPPVERKDATSQSLNLVSVLKGETPVPSKTGPSRTVPLLFELPMEDADPTETVPSVTVPFNGAQSESDSEQELFAFAASHAMTRRFQEIVRLLEQGAAPGLASPAAGVTATTIPTLPGLTGASAPGAAAWAILEQLDVPDQLVRAIRMQWENGVGQARLRLNPAGLGEVLVSLQIRQSTVSAVLSADSEAVRQWIRAHQHELRASLANVGLDLEELVVDADGRPSQQSHEPFEHGRRRPPRRVPSGARFEVRV